MRSSGQGNFTHFGCAPDKTRGGRWLLLFLFVLVECGITVAPAFAGPPFRTDDPQPVDFRHWEAYFFSTLDKTRDGRATQFPALEFNWGAFPNVQLHLIVPVASFRPPGGPPGSPVTPAPGGGPPPASRGIPAIPWHRQKTTCSWRHLL